MSIEPRRTIADATVLIALGRIDRLDLLAILDLPVLVTRVVWDEVAADSTLSAASALGAAVIVDERKARELVRTDPSLRAAIPATLTTVTLVVRAKREGLIAAVRPLLDELRREGLWLRQSVYDDALRSAGE